MARSEAEEIDRFRWLVCCFEPILKDDNLLGHSHICATAKLPPAREGTLGKEISLEAGLSLKFHIY